MTKEHYTHLRGIADDYASRLYREIMNLCLSDGFNNDADVSFLTSATIGTIFTLHMITLTEYNPALARVHRDQLEKLIKDSHEWL